MLRHHARIVAIAIGAACLMALPASGAVRGGTTKPSSSTAAKAVAKAVHLDANEAAAISTATYNGQTIDLANGWDGAVACLIPASGETECFSSLAAAQSAAVAISQAEDAASTGGGNSDARGGRLTRHGGACQGDSGEWMWLYSGTSWTGASLGIQNTDLWMDLDTVGFGNEAQSYSNDTGCEVYMSKGQGTTPWITASPWGAAASLGSWNRTLNSLDIAY